MEGLEQNQEIVFGPVMWKCQDGCTSLGSTKEKESRHRNLRVTEFLFAPSQLLVGVFAFFEVLSCQHTLVSPTLVYSVMFPTFTSCEASAWLFTSLSQQAN